MPSFALKSPAQTAQRRAWSVNPPRPVPALRQILRAPAVQTKLTVGAANDPAEHEADRAAAAVMRMPDGGAPVSLGAAQSSSAIHRMCAGCAEEKEGTLHRRAAGTDAPAQAPQIVQRVLREPGQPLDTASRAFFEPRFGHDFSNVRIHTGGEAARSAQAVNAHAYAAGSDIVFADGQYAPQSAQGRQVIAHELAHVAQQGAAPGGGEVRRLVRNSSMHCPPARLVGVRSPHVGAVDRRASELLGHAIGRISGALAAHATSPADPEVVAVGQAARTAFRLNPASADTWTAGAPQEKLPIILRRLQGAKNYIDSVVFTVTCSPMSIRPAHLCGAKTNGYSSPGVPAIGLCPHFWGQSDDQRARTWLHEALHITFVIIDDWTQVPSGARTPNIHNAHCYDQFVMLLNGLNAPKDSRCH